MEKLTNMVNMAKTESEQSYPVPTEQMKQPAYPYGLCISLCNDELDKLGLSEVDLKVGDMLHLHAMASITSVSMHDNINSGPSQRVELQITHLSAPVENEDEENEEMHKKMTPAKEKITKLYSNKS